MSNMTAYTDVSIDPVIRRKAEQILHTYQDDDAYVRLDTINEEDQEIYKNTTANKLTENGLKTLEKGRNTNMENQLDIRSTRSKTITVYSKGLANTIKAN